MSESQSPRKLDPKILKQVTAQIHRRYAEFDGCQPKVRLQSPPPESAMHQQTFLLTFSTPGTANTAQGPRKMPRYLRVVVDPSGKILKVTTSR
jgi:hypothetical protein